MFENANRARQLVRPVDDPDRGRIGVAIRRRYVDGAEACRSQKRLEQRTIVLANSHHCAHSTTGDREVPLAREESAEVGARRVLAQLDRLRRAPFWVYITSQFMNFRVGVGKACRARFLDQVVHRFTPNLELPPFPAAQRKSPEEFCEPETLSMADDLPDGLRLARPARRRLKEPAEARQLPEGNEDLRVVVPESQRHPTLPILAAVVWSDVEAALRIEKAGDEMPVINT